MEEADECRICRGTCVDGPLLQLCGCRGSMRFVHGACAIKWLQHSHRLNYSTTPLCDVCRQPFNVRVEGPFAYVRKRLLAFDATALADARTCVARTGRLLLDERVKSAHVLALRWLLFLLVLQLALWQGQLMLALTFAPLRLMLHLDECIDALIIPPRQCPSLPPRPAPCRTHTRAHTLTYAGCSRRSTSPSRRFAKCSRTCLASLPSLPSRAPRTSPSPLR